MSAARETPMRSIGQRLPVHTVNFVRVRLVVLRLLLGMLFVSAPTVWGRAGMGLSGKVSDQSGAGISGAPVILYSPDRILPTKTDQDGRFDFPHVPPGKYTLETSCTGFKAKAIEVVVIKEKSVGPLMITLNIGSIGCDIERLHAVSYEKPMPGNAALFGIVRVLDEHRAPLSMAKLALSKIGETRVLAEQTTNDKGEFQFADLESGKYVLRASHVGYTDVQAISFWVTLENRTRLTIEMYEKGMIFVCQ